jgi:hypothetical protein
MALPQSALLNPKKEPWDSLALPQAALLICPSNPSKGPPLTHASHLQRTVHVKHCLFHQRFTASSEPYFDS